MNTAKQRRQLRSLIDKADAIARKCKGETLRCVRGIRKELLYQLEGGGLSLAKSADYRDKLIMEVQRRINRLKTRLDALMDAHLHQTARSAYGAAKGMLEQKIDPDSIVAYSPKRMSAILAAISAQGGEGMAAKFTQAMSRNAVVALRDATVAAFREQAVAGMTQVQLSHLMRDKWMQAMKRNENFRFIDARGRVWNTETYLMMNVRTNSMQMYNDILIDTIARTTGSDLIRISWYKETDTMCEICREWQGRILSITGETKDFPSLAEAYDAGVFHPNCIHTLEPIVEDFDGNEIEAQRGLYV